MKKHENKTTEEPIGKPTTTRVVRRNKKPLTPSGINQKEIVSKEDMNVPEIIFLEKDKQQEELLNKDENGNLVEKLPEPEGTPLQPKLTKEVQKTHESDEFDDEDEQELGGKFEH
jgi:hypothetical protein